MFAGLKQIAKANQICRFRFYSTRKIPSIKPINKVLIANRGEIAVRVMRTCKNLGIRTIAVFSDADAKALHVSLADEAHHIGPALSQKSYLCGEKIIEVAKKTGAQAIHPGYGFLSESVEFSDLCQKENVIFIGPPASAIRDMGIKSTSKSIMNAAGVPCIGGYHGDDQSDEKLIAEAEIIGFPLMIKAVRGGGGKGMRIANDPSEFLPQLNSARTESEKAFGDSSMLLEKYVQSPRHVEVQVFADMYGNAVYLWERDCSVQRRHQKIIEEAPAPGISESLRRELGEAAVRAAKAVNYVGAGTVEFILDKNDLSFHFMEMNTRLQVEHPITEMITGVDLVDWQIRIAGGEPLPVTQEQITRNGHAFEARIYAENPRNNFLPGAGPLEHLTTPQANEFVRVETGVKEGDEVTVHYDPMIAKLVVWGRDRTQALNSLIFRLSNYHITGLDTNVNFLINLARHDYFQKGDVHTGFIDQHFESLFPPTTVSNEVLVQAAIGLIVNENNSASQNTLRANQLNDPFAMNLGFRINSNETRSVKFDSEGKEENISLTQTNDGFKVKVNDGEWRNVNVKVLKDDSRYTLKLSMDGSVSNFSVVVTPEIVTIFNQDGKTDLQIVQSKFLMSESDGLVNKSSLSAPMPGIIDRIFVNVGDEVQPGQSIAVIIAMKMEYVLKATIGGKVKSIAGKVGDNIGKGVTLVEID
ncbi:CLUMA_CG004841, isoform A [Clunio marinus]|uniref:CLUMA_CG004841, isoform A n=1 Tax=Clunio marinus TaxID=568069 RepID=A0A1J1HUW4_9DIPT|nr:CLUMA_CG004841, isoform A [Clunio marinus]